MSSTILWGDIEYEKRRDDKGNYRLAYQSTEDAPVPLGTTRVILGRLFFADSITAERVSFAFLPTRYSYHIKWSLFQTWAEKNLIQDR